MGLLYGRAECLTALFGGFWPGQNEFTCALCVLGHANELVQGGCLDPELQGFCTIPLPKGGHGW
jgi:hypothetical protein